MLGVSGSIRPCLRAAACTPGFLTSAATKGASNSKMMDVSRHKSVDILRGYVREPIPGSRRVQDFYKMDGAAAVAHAKRHYRDL